MARPNPRTPLALLLYWLAILPAFALWLWIDRVYAPWDHAYHSYLVMRLHDGLVHGNVWRFYELDRFYPPVFHLLAVPAAFLTDNPDAFSTGNWIALLVLLWATWRMGRSLAGTHAGLAAAMIVPSYIYVTWMGRMPMTDLCEATAVAVTLALLVRPIELADRRQARWLGIALGVGMLTRWAYAFFLFLPLAFELVRYLRLPRRADGGAWWRPLVPVVGWAIVIAAPWYVRSVPSILERLAWNLGAGVVEAEGDPPPFSLASFEYYGDVLADRYMTLVTWLLLAAGGAAVLWAWSRGARDARSSRSAAASAAAAADEAASPIAPPLRWLPLLLSAAGGLACLIAITNKDERYIMPLMPVFAVVSAAWVALLPVRRRSLAVGACAVLGYVSVIYNLFWIAPPDPTDWKVLETARVIADDLRGDGQRRVLVVPNDWHMNFMSMDYAIERQLGEKIDTDRVEGPIDRATLGRYDRVVLVMPPVEETVLSRHSIDATELVRSSPDWVRETSFLRGDGREIWIMAPRRG